MHILAKNSSGGLMHILKRIYDQLKKRGVNCLEQDNLGNNALHYAVDCGCYDLCQILIQEGININAVNNEGFSPLTILMKGERGA
jgi:ankyrin repeat protein